MNKETIELVKKMVEDGNLPQEVAIKYCPELEKDKDEKIRKALLIHLKNELKLHGNLGLDYGIITTDAIAWLEKQGKQKHKIQPKFKIGDVLHNIINGEDFIVDRISDACYINDDKCIYFPIREQEKLYLVEQKPADSKIIDLDELVIELEETIGTSPHSRETIKDFFQKAVQKYMRCLQIANGEIGRLMDENYYLKEQKPWSEEDENWLINAINVCELHNYNETADWLKSLKDRVLPQPKQEWSEEDVTMLDSAIAFVEHSAFTTIGKGKNNVIAWLKSLRERFTWKPSEEQLYTLEKATHIVGNKYKSCLASLYQDLKKLKG